MARDDPRGGVATTPAVATGFWVAPRDAARTLADIVARGQALSAGCAWCAAKTGAGRGLEPSRCCFRPTGGLRRGGAISAAATSRASGRWRSR